MEHLTPGALLKARRFELDLTVQDMAEKTRISRNYLEALEEDRFDVFPGEVYHKGFLRLYAAALGLNPDHLLRLCRERAQSQIDRFETPEPSGSPARFGAGNKRLWAAASLAVAIFLVGGFGLFAFRWFSPEKGRLEIVEKVRPGETFARTDRVAAPGNRPEAVSEKKTTPVTKNLPPVAPKAHGRFSTTVSRSVPFSRTPVGPSAKRVGSTLPPIPAGGAALRLQAVGAGLLEVSIDGRPPQRYLLKKGVSLSWNLLRSARLSVDHPGSVKVWLGDRPLDFGGGNQIALGVAKAATGEGKS